MFQDYSSLKPEARVWVYQANRILSSEEKSQIDLASKSFCEGWLTHGSPVSASFRIAYDQFLIFIAEDQPKISGCSIDSSVHFVEALGQKYGIDFFDRNTFAYMKDDEVHFVQSKDLPEFYKNNEITDDTLMFDNLVSTKEDFIQGWIKPLKESWHARMV